MDPHRGRLDDRTEPRPRTRAAAPRRASLLRPPRGGRRSPAAAPRSRRGPCPPGSAGWRGRRTRATAVPGGAGGEPSAHVGDRDEHARATITAVPPRPRGPRRAARRRAPPPCRRSPRGSAEAAEEPEGGGHEQPEAAQVERRPRSASTRRGQDGEAGERREHGAGEQAARPVEQAPRQEEEHRGDAALSARNAWRSRDEPGVVELARRGGREEAAERGGPGRASASLSRADSTPAEPFSTGLWTSCGTGCGRPWKRCSSAVGFLCIAGATPRVDGRALLRHGELQWPRLAAAGSSRSMA